MTLKNSENNGTEEIGLVTPTPEKAQNQNHEVTGKSVIILYLGLVWGDMFSPTFVTMLDGLN